MCTERNFSMFLMLLYKGILVKKSWVTIFGIAIALFLASVPLIVVSQSSLERTNETFYKPFSPYETNHNISAKSTLFLFTPVNNASRMLFREALQLWTQKVQPSGDVKILGVKSEEHLEKRSLYADAVNKDVIGTIFSNFERNDTLPESLIYTIRSRSAYSNKSFNTDKKYPIEVFKPRKDEVYKNSFFLSWQAAVEQSFIKLVAKNPASVDIKVMMQRFPFPALTHGEMMKETAPIIQWILPWVFFNPVTKFVVDMTMEKEDKLREFLRVMGMTSLAFWASHFLVTFSIGFVMCAFLAVLYKIPVGSETPVAFLQNSDGSVVFVLLVLCFTNLLAYAMAVSAFFTKVDHAAGAQIAIYAIIYMIMVVVYFKSDQLAAYLAIGLPTKLALCLHPGIAIIIVFRIIEGLENIGSGVQWNNFTEYPRGDNVYLLQVFLVILASVAMYCVITWYTDAVCPWLDGVPKPFYFPFTKSYWFGHPPRPYTEGAEVVYENPAYIEPDPPGAEPTVVIRNLRKVFKTRFRETAAVDGVSMNIYPNEITAVLGPNGAGKTSTINILTGLYRPDAGTALINGYDICAQTEEARRGFGVCPQEKSLYNELTVRQHLKIFAAVKGVRLKDLSSVANEALNLVKLSEKADEKVKNLSGGMKQRLCLAIAVIGDSKVLFLDEPTVGLDPENRRILWDLLLDIRQGRTVVLTTQHMEEADVLGDRIAILVAGKLKCCGSQLFLKRHFGTGYSLHIAKEPSCRPEDVTAFVQKYVQGSACKSDTETEITYSFPSDTRGSRFVNMFQELETKAPDLGIRAYGMTITTMDDVFLKFSHLYSSPVLPDTVTSQVDEDAASTTTTRKEFEKDVSDESVFLTQYSKKRGRELWTGRLKSLIVKRYYLTKHLICSLFVYSITPLLMTVLLAYVVQTVRTISKPAPSLLLEPASIYTNPAAFSVSALGKNNLSDSYYIPVLGRNGFDYSVTKDPNSYILDLAETSLNEYLVRLLVGGNCSDPREVISWYNGQPYHALPISLNMVHTALLNYYGRNKTGYMKLTNSPLPATWPVQFIIFQKIPVAFAVGSGFLITTLLAYLFPHYMLIPILERTEKMKLLQLLTGTGVVTYWLSNLLWDMVLLLTTSILMLIPFPLLTMDTVFLEPDVAGSMLLVLLLYSLSGLPILYTFSLVFRKAQMGVALIAQVNLLIGFLSLITISVLSGQGITGAGFRAAVWALRLLPIFSGGWGFSKVLSASLGRGACEIIPQEFLDRFCNFAPNNTEVIQCCTETCGDKCFKEVHPLTWEETGAGREILFLALSFVVWSGVLILAERISHRVQCPNLRAIGKNKKARVESAGASEEDSSVVQEAQSVAEAGPSAALHEALVVLGLTKDYGTFRAVDGLTFAVHKNECFGLLGVNGAGKTTTFKMLTGDVVPSKGDAYIQRYSLRENLHKFHSLLGYCPQSNALLKFLTGRQTLNLFASLRGLTSASTKKVVNRLLEMMDLVEHADKLIIAYSGGNKRKLSVAISILCAPPVILLDEPTPAIDPVMRRKVWRILSEVREVGGSAIILCTQSMEESENLCQRLAIMVNGQFRCLGSIQQLKSTFAQGYMITIKPKREVIDDEEVVSAISNHFQSIFPSAVLRDKTQGVMRFHVTDVSVRWSSLFANMEDMKKEFDIEDYLISGTTLEQIFITFAKSQRFSAEYT